MRRFCNMKIYSKFVELNTTSACELERNIRRSAYLENKYPTAIESLLAGNASAFCMGTMGLGKAHCFRLLNPYRMYRVV